MLRRKRTGQSTAEYAIVIGLVIAAVVAMQIYVKRGIQAKIKGVVDYQPNAMFTTTQYEPDYASSNMTSSRTASQTIDTRADGEVIRGFSAAGEVSQRTGTQTTAGLPE
jgi:hypothetical protein